MWSLQGKRGLHPLANRTTTPNDEPPVLSEFPIRNNTGENMNDFLLSLREVPEPTPGLRQGKKPTGSILRTYTYMEMLAANNWGCWTKTGWEPPKQQLSAWFFLRWNQTPQSLARDGSFIPPRWKTCIWTHWNKWFLVLLFVTQNMEWIIDIYLVCVILKEEKQAKSLSQSGSMGKAS